MSFEQLFTKIRQKVAINFIIEHEYANFNFFAKVFEYKGFKYKFEWLGLT